MTLSSDYQNLLVMQYEGPDFRERIGEDWPQEELGFYRSEGIGPSGRDITTAGSGDVKSCHHKGLAQREGLCRTVAGGILIQEARRQERALYL